MREGGGGNRDALYVAKFRTRERPRTARYVYVKKVTPALGAGRDKMKTREQNRSVCIQIVTLTLCTCQSVAKTGRLPRDRRFDSPGGCQEIADLTVRDAAKRSQISAIERLRRDRRFDRPGDYQEIADLTDRAATNRSQISVRSCRTTITKI